MDFIERWLGVSPDGGNGTFELLIVASVAAVVLALAYRRRMLEFALRWLAPRFNARSNT
jgi:hypothetical protein